MGKVKVIYLCAGEEQACQFVDGLCTAFFGVKHANKSKLMALDAPKGRELGKFLICDKSGNQVHIVGRNIGKNFYNAKERAKIQQLFLSRKAKPFRILKEIGLRREDFFERLLIIYDFPMTTAMSMILAKALRDYCKTHGHTKPYISIDENRIRNTLFCRIPADMVITRYGLTRSGVEEAPHDFKDPALKCFADGPERARALGAILYASAALLATEPKRRKPS